MVAIGTHVNSGCCYDFGNAETNLRDNGGSHMDTVNLTTYCEFSPCSGSGPWVEADLENGQYMGGNGSNPADTTSNSPFVTAVLKNNGQTTFELEAGYPTDAADAAVQADIASVGYSGATGGGAAPAGTITGPGGQCLDVSSTIRPELVPHRVARPRSRRAFFTESVTMSIST